MPDTTPEPSSPDVFGGDLSQAMSEVSDMLGGRHGVLYATAHQFSEDDERIVIDIHSLTFSGEDDEELVDDHLDAEQFERAHNMVHDLLDHDRLPDSPIAVGDELEFRF